MLIVKPFFFALCSDWKEMVDEWVKATSTTAMTGRNFLSSFSSHLIFFFYQKKKKKKQDICLHVPSMKIILLLFCPFLKLVNVLKVALLFVGSEGGTPDSVNPSVLDEEEGLPSPPLDEGAFFVAQTGSIELSQVLTGPFSHFSYLFFCKI